MAVINKWQRIVDFIKEFTDKDDIIENDIKIGIIKKGTIIKGLITIQKIVGDNIRVTYKIKIENDLDEGGDIEIGGNTFDVINVIKRKDFLEIEGNKIKIIMKSIGIINKSLDIEIDENGNIKKYKGFGIDYTNAYIGDLGEVIVGDKVQAWERVTREDLEPEEKCRDRSSSRNRENKRRNTFEDDDYSYSFAEEFGSEIEYSEEVQNGNEDIKDYHII